uniref:Uncharacterized protein n=1 Tax=Anguilla anguilla TaxID=7936 RepID=A0A0E9U8E8_ANGAN
MNSLQELQLLEIMCSYFQEQSKDAVRQIIFSALFSPQGNKADDNRMAMLGKTGVHGCGCLQSAHSGVCCIVAAEVPCCLLCTSCQGLSG